MYHNMDVSYLAMPWSAAYFLEGKLQLLDMNAAICKIGVVRSVPKRLENLVDVLHTCEYQARLRGFLIRSGVRPTLQHLRGFC